MSIESAENDSDEFEEVYVYASINGDCNLQPNTNIHVLGIDTEKPIVQIDQQIYTGKLESALGTYLFFEKDVSNLNKMAKANKTLTLNRAYIKPKCEEIKAPELIEIQGEGEQSTSRDESECEKIKNIEEGLNKLIEMKIWQFAEAPKNIPYLNDRKSPELS